jgi:hypothetical protein
MMTTNPQYTIDDLREAVLANDRDTINKFDVSTVNQFIAQFEEKWCLGQRSIDVSSAFINSFKIFYDDTELDTNGLPMNVEGKDLASCFKHKLGDLRVARGRADVLNILYEPYQFDEDYTVNDKLNILIHSVCSAYELIGHTQKLQSIVMNPRSKEHIDPEKCKYMTSSYCSTMDNIEDISPYQRVILYLLTRAQEMGVKRYKSQCCREIETPTGQKTKAWKAKQTIPEFVYSQTQKEDKTSIWLDLTSKGACAREVIKHLAECNDAQFPEIVKSRHRWSFQNGMLFGKVWDTKNEQWTCAFYPYDSAEYMYQHKIDCSASAKYFDKPFKTYDTISDWYDIPTPHFQSILDYQGFEPDVSKWMYVIGGRLCFNVGDLDGWQVIPFLKGIARSGKSTLITKVFKKFYESEDSRTLSNNIEKKFGLSSIFDGFLFIAPEVKGDLALEQAEFQSLVSGEDVSIARKYEKAVSVEWTTPGILGGNEIPNWKDNSGSVLRRLLAWNFGKQVMEADPHLDEKLDEELPAIMMKCLRAYHDYARKYSSQDIWNVVPKYFKNIQTQVAMVTNSLQNFLASEKVQYGKELYCPQKLFVQLFNQHCQENNLGRFKFNPDFYAGPFSTRQLEVRTEAKVYKGRAYPAQPMVFGIDIIEDTMQFSDDM